MYLLSIIFAISHSVVVIYSHDQPPTALCIKKNVDISSVEQVIYPYSESFLDLIIKSSAWVDKTLLLQTLAESCKKYHIITCARRWGKSVTLSMVKLFLEIPTNEYGIQKDETLELMPQNESHAYWFFRQGIIYDPRNKEKILLEDKPQIASYLGLDNHMQQYPVILLDFKAMIGFEGCMDILEQQITKAFKSHCYLLDTWHDKLEDSTLRASSKDQIHTKIDTFRQYKQGSPSIPGSRIKFLIDELRFHHGKGVIVLIDEYDAYYNNIYFSGYPSNEEEAKKILEFCRRFFEDTFKGNNNVHKLIMTGISRFAEVSTFSGMNEDLEETNFVNMRELSPFYGINLNEFKKLASKRMIDEEAIQNAISHYDGYSVLRKPGLKHISAWTLVNFVNKRFVGDFWRQTSAPSAIFKLLKYPSFMKSIRELLNDIPINICYSSIAMLSSMYGKRLNDLMHAKEEKHSDIDVEANEAAFALLVQAGYLTLVDHHEHISEDIQRGDDTMISLKIPNEEVKYAVQSYCNTTTLFSYN